MIVQYYRFFLNVSNQMQLFQAKQPEKTEILSEFLGNKKFRFKHGRSNLAFVPYKQIGNAIFGGLGKKSRIKRGLPPEKDFAELEEEHWPHSKIYIDVSGDKDKGQMIAVEMNGVFSEPLHALRKLEDEINRELTPAYGYVMSVNPITEEKEFWKIIDDNENKIERVTFCYQSPNLFELQNSLNADLKKIKESFNATGSSISLENEEGKLVVPKNKLTQESVEYIAKGGGEYKIKVKGMKTPLKGTKKVKSRNVDQSLDIDISVADRDTFLEVFSKIFL